MIARLRSLPHPVRGRDAVELLEAVRSSCRYQEASLEAWMTAYATRLCRWDGRRPIDASTPEAFLAGLVDRGELTLLES